MPKLDLDTIPQTRATGYPPEYADVVKGRLYRRLAPAGGLVHMGASYVVLEAGGWSSQRHWHDGEDELVVMLAGEAMLIDDHGKQRLIPGDIAVFPAGKTNGHHLHNRTAEPCTFVAISAGPKSGGGYSDIDMIFTADGRYCHKDGRDYGATRA